MPLAAWLTFSGLTIAAFAFGPYSFSESRSRLLYVYLFAVHVAVIVGYVVGVRTFRVVTGGRKETPVDRVIAILGPFAVASVAIALIGNLSYGLDLSASLNDPNWARRVWIEQRSG